AGGVSVSYATSDGTAHAGEDYASTSGILSFGPGVMSQAFAVPILQDDVPEGVETVGLSLSAPGGGAVLGPVATAVVSTVDDEPVVESATEAVSVSEAAGAAVLVVRRLGPLAGPASVDYGGAASGTLAFAAGVAQRMLAVPIRDDSVAGGTRTL